MPSSLTERDNPSRSKSFVREDDPEPTDPIITQLKRNLRDVGDDVAMLVREGVRDSVFEFRSPADPYLNYVRQ